MSNEGHDQAEPQASAPAAQPEWTHTVTGGEWPDRIGHRARIVSNDDAKVGGILTFFAAPDDQVIVLIEDDPFGASAPDRPWSCVISVDALAPIE